MANKTIVKWAQKILKRPDLEFSNDIPTSYFLMICRQRFAMLIRGIFRGLFLGKKGKRLFIGKNVKLYCANKIAVGNGVSIQDFVIINALSKEGVQIGDNTSIGTHTTIKVSGSMVEIGKSFKIGCYSAIANDCFIGAAGGVEIGDYVAIGQNVRFHSENHEFSDSTRKICEQGTTHKGIKIGNDCWVGAGAVFLDGSALGDGCVVGANAVVTGRFEPYSVIAGVPAQVIKMRR